MKGNNLLTMVGGEAEEGVDAVGHPRHGVALEEELVHNCTKEV